MYHFVKSKKDTRPEKIWLAITKSLTSKSLILSITDIIYELLEVSNEGITYRARIRSAHEPETISKQNAIIVLQGLIKIGAFNTVNTKSLFRQTKIYRQRSPIFATLIASGIIQKLTA